MLLLDYITSLYVHDSIADSESHEKLYEAYQLFIEGKISLEECRERINALNVTTEPLDKLNRILAIGNSPIQNDNQPTNTPHSSKSPTNNILDKKSNSPNGQSGIYSDNNSQNGNLINNNSSNSDSFSSPNVNPANNDILANTTFRDNHHNNRNDPMNNGNNVAGHALNRKNNSHQNGGYNGYNVDSDNDKSRKKSHCWTTYEDERLLAGIHKYGIDNWSSIARFVGNSRTRSQCSQRWFRGLDPRLSKNQWTREEEAMLLQLVSMYGDKSWTQIANKIGNRSDVQCRYHYKQIHKEFTTQNAPFAPFAMCGINPMNPMAQVNQMNNFNAMHNMMNMNNMNMNGIAMNQINQMNTMIAMNQMNNQINSQMNSQINSQMNNQINSQMNSQINSQMNNQMNYQMNNQMNYQMNNQLNNPMNNNLNNMSGGNNLGMDYSAFQNSQVMPMQVIQNQNIGRLNQSSSHAQMPGMARQDSVNTNDLQNTKKKSHKSMKHDPTPRQPVFPQNPVIPIIQQQQQQEMMLLQQQQMQQPSVPQMQPQPTVVQPIQQQQPVQQQQQPVQQQTNQQEEVQQQHDQGCVQPILNKQSNGPSSETNLKQGLFMPVKEQDSVFEKEKPKNEETKFFDFDEADIFSNDPLPSFSIPSEKDFSFF